MKATFAPKALEEMSEGERELALTPFSAARARLILKHIPDGVLTEMGMRPSSSRPEDMILETIPVPPTCVRPSVGVDNGSRSRGHDDLTLKLQDILKVSTHLREGGTPEVVARLRELLHVHVCLYYDKDSRPAGIQKIRNDPSMASSMLPARPRASRWRRAQGQARPGPRQPDGKEDQLRRLHGDHARVVAGHGHAGGLAVHHAAPDGAGDGDGPQHRRARRRVRNGPKDVGAHSIEHCHGKVVSLWPLAEEVRAEVAGRPRSAMSCIGTRRWTWSSSTEPSLHRESMMGTAVPVDGLTFR